MSVQQTSIYHCLRCGNVIYQEDEAGSPECCGTKMVRAASDFVWELNEQGLRKVPQEAREIITKIQSEHRELLQRLAAERAHWNSVETPSAANYSEMRDRLHALREELAAHFAKEERDGYLTHVLSAAPQFDRRVSHLCQEHRDFLERLDQLIGRLRVSEPETWKEARADFGRLVVELRRHEAAETALVRMAFTSDEVGPAD